MRICTLLLTLALLSACGVAGAPVPPAQPAKTGISVSGTASAGVTARL